MARQILTEAQWKLLVEAYTAYPAAHSKVSRDTGIKLRTCRQAWDTGITSLPFASPAIRITVQEIRAARKAGATTPATKAATPKKVVAPKVAAPPPARTTPARAPAAPPPEQDDDAPDDEADVDQDELVGNTVMATSSTETPAQPAVVVTEEMVLAARAELIRGAIDDAKMDNVLSRGQRTAVALMSKLLRIGERLMRKVDAHLKTTENDMEVDVNERVSQLRAISEVAAKFGTVAKFEREIREANAANLRAIIAGGEALSANKSARTLPKSEAELQSMISYLLQELARAQSGLRAPPTVLSTDLQVGVGGDTKPLKN